MALVDNLFADKHLPVGSALVEMLHIIQYWTKILERSTRPTIHLVVELYYYGHSILLRLLTTDQTKHPFRCTETMIPFVENFFESFKRTMVPSSFHYLAAFINPLTGCLTKRCDYPPNWKSDVADADKMEVLLIQHMEKVFYGMAGPEKREMYKQVKKKEAVHQHNLRLKTDEFENVEILSSSPTDQDNEEIDSDFLDPDWHEYCTEQIKNEILTGQLSNTNLDYVPAAITKLKALIMETFILQLLAFKPFASFLLLWQLVKCLTQKWIASQHF